MNTLQITTSVPPSTNNAYLNLSRGRALTPKGKAYKKEAGTLALKAGVQQMRLSPPYTISAVFYFPDRRKRDVTNHIKLAEDALMEAIGGDDSDVKTVWLQKRTDAKNPRAEITLEGTR